MISLPILETLYKWKLDDLKFAIANTRKEDAARILDKVFEVQYLMDHHPDNPRNHGL